VRGQPLFGESGRSACHERGRPSPRVAMTLRCTSLVPPRMVAGTVPMSLVVAGFLAGAMGVTWRFFRWE